MYLQLFSHFAAACKGGSFLAFPPWYKYLDSETIDGVCTPRIHGINDIWLIVAAVIEILIRVAALAAIGFIIYAGFEYMTSQGQPDKTHHARSMLVNAIVGLVIAILSAAIVNFVAGKVS